MRSLAVLAVLVLASCSSFDTRIAGDRLPRTYDGPGDVMFELARYSADNYFGRVDGGDLRERTLFIETDDFWAGATEIRIHIVEVGSGISRIDFQSREVGWSAPFWSRLERDCAGFFETLDWYYGEHVAGRDPTGASGARNKEDRFRELRALYDSGRITESEYNQAQKWVLTAD